MKNVMLIFVLLFVCFILGCTNAGPYVTDIAFDGEGNLLVTKNTVVFNSFFGTVQNGEQPQTITIKMPKNNSQVITGYQATIDPKTGTPVTQPVYKDK